jgi:hypothetical protein
MRSGSLTLTRGCRGVPCAHHHAAPYPHHHRARRPKGASAHQPEPRPLGQHQREEWAALLDPTHDEIRVPLAGVGHHLLGGVPPGRATRLRLAAGDGGARGRRVAGEPGPAMSSPWRRVGKSSGYVGIGRRSMRFSAPASPTPGPCARVAGPLVGDVLLFKPGHGIAVRRLSLQERGPGDPRHRKMPGRCGRPSRTPSTRARASSSSISEQASSLSRQRFTERSSPRTPP